MRVVEVARPGGPEQLRVTEGPRPEPRAGELLIEVAAAGINRPDVFQRMGAYPPPPDASPVLGLEVAGRVVALGAGVDAWRVGDAVCALTPGGGYAGFCTAPAGQVLPVPEGLSMEQAAALPETLFTVWGNVFQRGRLVAGETLLVHGGSSGIGTTAIQLGVALGITVLATARGADKCAACTTLGAARAIDTTREDFVAIAGEHTAGRGVDVILDMLGGDFIPKNLEALAVEGRLVFIAFLRGAAAKVDFQQVQRKRLTVTGSTLRPQSIAAKARIAAELHQHVWPLIEAGRIRPVIDRVFDFADVVEAHRHLDAGTHVGKVVLKL